MLIAVTYENGMIGQHFGHTQFFKIFSIEDGQIMKSGVIDTQGNGHGALVGFLTAVGVDAVICGGIGPGAIEGLKSAGITVYAGNSGDPDAAVLAVLDGSLGVNDNANCNHHGEGHNCAGHSCGHHGMLN